MAVDSVQNSLASLFQTKTASTTKLNSDLGMNDFLQLIAAQIQNQDMMNPMQDTDMIAQMAQFSSLQAMQELMSVSMTSYSVGLLDKEVTVARLSSRGELETKTGTVTGVGLYDGSPIVYVDGEQYYLGEIMIVGKPPNMETEESTNPEEEGEPEEKEIPGGEEDKTSGGE